VAGLYERGNEHLGSMIKVADFMSSVSVVLVCQEGLCSVEEVA
jgi:hypothetical protein